MRIEIQCNKCRCKYVGETSRTGHYGAKQHMTALAVRDGESVLWRHTSRAHCVSDPGEPPPQHSMNITGYSETALERQITEAVKINNTPNELRLSTRKEWGHTRWFKQNSSTNEMT